MARQYRRRGPWQAGHCGLRAPVRRLTAPRNERCRPSETSGWSRPAAPGSAVEPGKVGHLAAGLADAAEQVQAVAAQHRVRGIDLHRLEEGIDRGAQVAFLERHHLANKTDCHTCWARPLCSGGCYHEAHVQYGTSSHPNLHYCTWVRSWTHTCLEIYGALAEKNPKFLNRFDA